MMPWVQIYDPLGNAWLSTLAAALPIILLLGTLAVLEWKAHWAALTGLASALLVSIAIYGMPPSTALANPIELMAYAMKHSTTTDMALLLRHVGHDGLVEALDNAPPGIIDPRSWAYWNAKVGRFPAPPRPTRHFPR